MTAALLALALGAAPELTTTAERTGYARTGRYAEVAQLCRALAAAFPRRARCLSYGRTPEGRELLALAASADGVLDPAAARARGRKVVELQGAIHAGEMDGKDAGFEVLRELLATPDGGPLRRVTALFVPLVNPDGHERFGPDQRPNQAGPAETGWRTTAQNLNLNRDWVKAEAPELQALLRLLGEWDPIALADLHVTDGARFRVDVSVGVEPRLDYAPELRAAGAALSDALLARLAAAGHLPVDFYPELRVHDDPRSGFVRGVPPPRLGHGYWASRNRLGILLETHSWRPYRHRVAATADFLRALLELAAAQGGAWRAAARAADKAALAGAEVAVAWSPGPDSTSIEFPGYAWEHLPSAALGRKVVRYDTAAEQTWQVPLGLDLPAERVRLPRGGWIVPVSQAAWVAPKLRLHRIAFEAGGAGRGRAPVEVFRAASSKVSPESFEGRQRAEVTGAWAPEKQDLAPGWLWVPAAQPGARLAALLLEPRSPDGLLAWGYFNAFLERKEYLEDYLLAPFADDLLARDPEVRAAFEARLADPAFAADPAARAEFFYRRHPAADQAWGLYPVLRAAAQPRPLP
jgi:murein tripeptide amidase MpaA